MTEQEKKQPGTELTFDQLDQVTGGADGGESEYCTCKNPVYKPGTQICVYCGKKQQEVQQGQFGMYF